MGKLTTPVLHWGYFAWRPFGTWGASLWWDRPLLFSERNGYKRVFRIGRLAIEFWRK